MSIAASGSPVSANNTNVSSLSLTSWTPAANDIIILMVTTRNTTATHNTPTGNNATWTQIFQGNNSTSSRVSVWQGVVGASPSSGQISITFTASVLSAVALAERFSGVDQTTPVEANATTSTTSASPSGSVTTLTANALVVQAIHERDATFTPNAGFTTIQTNVRDSGTANDQSSCSMMSVAAPTTGSYIIDGTLSISRVWRTVTMSLKPASGVNTAKTITATIGNTLSVRNNIGKPITKAITITPVLAKAIAYLMSVILAITSTISVARGMVVQKAITLGIHAALSIQKTITKPILRTITTTLIRNTTIPKHADIVSVIVPSFQRNIALSKSKTITITTFVANTYYRYASVIVNASLIITRNILKPVSFTQSVFVTLAPKSISKTITKAVAITVSGIVGKGYVKEIAILIQTTSSLGGKIVHKSLSVTTSITPMLQRRISINRLITVSVNRFFSKLLDAVVMYVPSVKDARTIAVNATSKLASTLGRNSRNLRIKEKNRND